MTFSVSTAPIVLPFVSSSVAWESLKTKAHQQMEEMKPLLNQVLDLYQLVSPV
jgi:hypothetical protein